MATIETQELSGTLNNTNSLRGTLNGDNNLSGVLSNARSGGSGGGEVGAIDLGIILKTLLSGIKEGYKETENISIEATLYDLAYDVPEITQEMVNKVDSDLGAIFNKGLNINTRIIGVNDYDVNVSIPTTIEKEEDNMALRYIDTLYIDLQSGYAIAILEVILSYMPTEERRKSKITMNISIIEKSS